MESKETIFKVINCHKDNISNTGMVASPELMTDSSAYILFNLMKEPGFSKVARDSIAPPLKSRPDHLI